MSSKYHTISTSNPKLKTSNKKHLTIDCSLKDLSTDPTPLTNQIKSLKNNKSHLKTQTTKPNKEKEKQKTRERRLFNIKLFSKLLW